MRNKHPEEIRRVLLVVQVARCVPSWLNEFINSANSDDLLFNVV
jgi:hypothetical protein